MASLPKLLKQIAMILKSGLQHELKEGPLNLKLALADVDGKGGHVRVGHKVATYSS